MALWTHQIEGVEFIVLDLPAKTNTIRTKLKTATLNALKPIYFFVIYIYKRVSFMTDWFFKPQHKRLKLEG